MMEELRLVKTLKDGRIKAVNVWATGYQELVYPNMASFERAKVQVEQDGKVPVVRGYTEA